MTYTVANNEVIMFLVIATEPVAGCRLPFLKTFSMDEALKKSWELEGLWGPSSNIKIEEVKIGQAMWEHKFAQPWPI